MLLGPVQESVNHEVNDPKVAARTIASERSLGGRLSRLFLLAIADEIESGRTNWTMYDVINILTALQHNESIRQNQRFQLQDAGAEATINSHLSCSVCHREL